MHLNTFGTASHKTQSCSVVKLSLQKLGRDEIITISVLSSPFTVPSAVDIRRFAHLNELPLADSSSDDEDSIDILVGSNYYWTIVTGDLRRGEDRPIAASSKFGWLLSGPIPPFSTNSLSHTHVVIMVGFDGSTCDDRDTALLTTLQKFWETRDQPIMPA